MSKETYSAARACSLSRALNLVGSFMDLRKCQWRPSKFQKRRSEEGGSCVCCVFVSVRVLHTHQHIGCVCVCVCVCKCLRVQGLPGHISNVYNGSVDTLATQYHHISNTLAPH